MTTRASLPPWYVIARRSIFMLPAYVSLCIFVAIVFLGWGRNAARKAWDNSR